ncbi:MATE efflux family protein [Halovivax asiaticus JCM 14624]|uniref:Multidrug-efflux transporter n=1 Tax=Halovivax asiaticus JCM 14624 TaxID=1227490 RepID=M0BVQ9_9EURY|nr:MATE family efflux transporter [Halovivax asiaticus]ELZ14202.1 MATE efflux family protein [Halovivax asiaticus JCM 14624]
MRLTILWIGLGLARLGLIDRERAVRTADLAWPRIVTGLARMSKSAVDVAMVGIAVGEAAIAGVGFATPFWGLAFTIGGGVAGGTIALVSQRYGAEQFDELGEAIRSSILLVLLISLPVTAFFVVFSTELVSIITTKPEPLSLGASYLSVVAFGVPFAGLNLIGSRTFVGMDDAWTPMIIRAGGAIANIGFSAAFIFVADLGVAGAALGTVLANVVVSAGFATLLIRGSFPGVPDMVVTIDPFGSYVNPEIIRSLVSIGTPVFLRNMVWTVAELPLLGIVDIFGTDTASAFVITRRIWGLMNTPGWGFSLAASSLVGQELGTGAEDTAAEYGNEIIRYSVAVYAVSATIVFVFAEPIVQGFVDEPGSQVVPIAISLVYAACVAILFRGIVGSAEGALNAAGDTRWPFYAQLLGMFGGAIPLAYIGATTSLGIWGLYLAFVAETAVPAVVNYYRFGTGRWRAISRSYRPGGTTSDD